MRQGLMIGAAGALTLMLPGCVAKTVAEVAVKQAANTVTAPVRRVYRSVDTVNTVVDKLTTSDSERDQKRGRALRKQEERVGKLSREYEELSRKCDRGKEKACRQRYEKYDELRTAMGGMPRY